MSQSKLTGEECRHLLRRLSFAASPETTAALEGSDRPTAFNRLCEWSASTAPAVRAPSVEQARQRWLAQMITSPAGLRENCTLFFHGLLGSSTESVPNATALQARVDVLRRECLNTVPDLLAAVVLDPAMMLQIGMNDHGLDRVSDRPAKLVLEHWTVGPGAYSDREVEELSRALTGWQVRAEGVDEDTEQARRVDSGALVARFHAEQFETGPKTLFGVTRELDAVGAIRFVAMRPETARRFCAKLARHVGVLAPSPSLSARLESAYLQSGGSIRTVLGELVASDEFWSFDNRWALIKSPAHLAVGACKQLGLNAPSVEALDAWLSACGQSLFDTPNNGEGGWADQEAWISPPDRLALRYALFDALSGQPPRLGFTTSSNRIAASTRHAPGGARGDVHGAKAANPIAALAARTASEIIERLDPAPSLPAATHTSASFARDNAAALARCVLASPQYQLA